MRVPWLGHLAFCLTYLIWAPVSDLIAYGGGADYRTALLPITQYIGLALFLIPARTRRKVFAARGSADVGNISRSCAASATRSRSRRSGSLCCWPIPA